MISLALKINLLTQSNSAFFENSCLPKAFASGNDLQRILL